MRVPDEILKCTAFMAYRKDERFVLVGTAFFVGVPVVDVTMLPRFRYLVTAKHVIEHIESYSDDYYAYVRVNVRGPENEGVGWLRTEVENWYFHPEEDSAVDVAVYQFWDSRLDQLWYPIESFAKRDILHRWNVGIGDEVFLTGLFGFHSGKERNLPVLRSGNIAAMPEEAVETDYGLMDAYLVEVRSIGGISGSPVFLNLSAFRNPAKNVTVFQGGGQFYLLGMIHGHWDQRISARDAIAIDEDFAGTAERLNTGIAIVTPATKILEVIRQPELEAMRRENEVEVRKSLLPTTDVSDEPEE